MGISVSRIWFQIFDFPPRKKALAKVQQASSSRSMVFVSGMRLVLLFFGFRQGFVEVQPVAGGLLERL